MNGTPRQEKTLLQNDKGFVMNVIYLYGVGGTLDSYRVIHYTAINQEEASVLTMKYELIRMKTKYPGIQKFFVIDQRPGLAKMVANSMKKDSVEDRVLLLDYLCRNGIELK